MSDLIVAALSGAGVTITVAICVTYLGLQLSEAKTQLANARVADAKKEGSIAVAAANERALIARAELAERRLLDADALISEMVRDLPVDGAFERLLRSYTRARSLDGTGSTKPEAVPDKPTSGTSGSDELINPFDES